MQSKRQLLVIILALTVPVMISQNVDLWTQKITIENSLRDKLTFAISRVLDENQFFVNVEVELATQTGPGVGSIPGSEDGGTPEYLADYESVTPGITEESEQQPEPETTAPVYSPIPGLPAIPAVEEKEEPVKEEPAIQSPAPSGRDEVRQQYSYQDVTTSAISSVDVTIYLEESVATAGTKRDVIEIVCGIIPKTQNCADCNDCVSFKQMEFKGELTEETKSTELEDRLSTLESTIDEQKEEIAKMEKEKLNNMLSTLQSKLEGIETERNLLVRLDRIEDSTRLANLVRKEEKYQDRRDSLLLVLEQKREEALNQRISAESKYAEKLFTLAEKQLEKAYQAPGSQIQAPGNNQFNGSGLGLQYPGSSQASNDWIWVLITLIIVGGLVVSLILLKNQKKPVYLKQKTVKKDTPPDNGDNNTHDVPAAIPPTPPVQHEPPPETPPATSHVGDDTDVIKSEVKSLRQSAVTMSVGQKEAATKIIQDWLDEPAKGESAAEGE